MFARKALLILFLSVIVVTAIEGVKLTTASLWHDESFSALLVQYDFGEMMERIKQDVHPPLYYIVLKGWNFIFGNSLFSLRFFSIFFSILAIASFYLFIKKAFKKNSIALFSSLLFVFSYFQIQYAMEARMYSMGTFLVIISSFFLLKAMETKAWKYWILYALAISAGIYTHYFVAFWILAQALYLAYCFLKDYGWKVAAWIKDKNLKRAFVSYLLAAISYIPWLPTLIKQTAQVQENYWIPEIGIWSIPSTFFKMTTGGTISTEKFGWILGLLMLIVIALMFWFLKKSECREKWLVFLMLAIPFAATVVLSIKRSIFIDRYFIFGFPFFIIMIAGSILLIGSLRWKKILIGLVLIGAIITFPIQWGSLEAEKKPGMAGASQYLNSKYSQGDKIFAGSSLIYFTFRYYNQTGFPAKLYAPGNMPHYSGTALLSPEDIIADFNKEAKKGDIVWKIDTTGFGGHQPEAPETWKKLDEKGFQDIYDYRGWIIVKKYKVD